LRITLAELEVHRIKGSETFEPGSLNFQDVEFRQKTPVKVDFTAELLVEEIRVRGHLETRLESTCDRCLMVVEIPVKSDFDLFYRPMQNIATDESEIELPPAELEVGFFTGDGIELADVVAEQVILAMPMKVVCSADCKGLCPVCGVNRNITVCNCAPPKGSSPFDALREG
jgi:uncharacterized protein